MRVSVVATHPIQYQAPWFRTLAAAPGVDLTVHYAVIPDAQSQGVGFGVAFNWDLPLLEGYRWEKLSSRRRDGRIGAFLSTRVDGMRSALLRARPDALLLTGWNSIALVQALFAARRLRIPCVVRGESTALRTRPAVVRRVHRSLLERYDGFLAIGVRNREFYEGYRLDPRRIFACPYFVDNDRFRTSADLARRQRRELRSKWGIPEQSTCFLFAGKLQPVKRCGNLIAALALAARRKKKIHLLVVGAGEEEASMRREATGMGLPVSFAGFLNQSEIPNAYAAADCLVLPSESETWGLVVNEAMACGLPAIVSDTVGCAPDLVIEGGTGFTFRMGDVEALAERMTDLASEAALLAKMGLNARRHVTENYSVERAVKGTLAALEFVTGQRFGLAAGG